MRKLLSGIVTLATLIFILEITGCTKDDTPTPVTETSIVGLWLGTYAVDGQSTAHTFNLTFKPDGTLINDSEGGGQQHLNIGTWTLSGTQLTFHTTCVYGLSTNIGVEEDYNASFDKATGKITNGTWENTPPVDGSGTFQVSKVN